VNPRREVSPSRLVFKSLTAAPGVGPPRQHPGTEQEEQSDPDVKDDVHQLPRFQGTLQVRAILLDRYAIRYDCAAAGSGSLGR